MLAFIITSWYMNLSGETRFYFFELLTYKFFIIFNIKQIFKNIKQNLKKKTKKQTNYQ